MKHLDLVRSFFHAIEDGDIRRAMRMCDRDFVVLAPGHTVLGASEFQQVIWALVGAFPDLRYELHDLAEDTHVVTGRMEISGTHTRDLEIPLWQLPVIPATGRRVVLPGEPLEVALHQGKIRRVGSSLIGARGMLAPVQALGVELSPAGAMG